MLGALLCCECVCVLLLAQRAGLAGWLNFHLFSFNSLVLSNSMGSVVFDVRGMLGLSQFTRLCSVPS